MRRRTELFKLTNRGWSQLRDTPIYQSPLKVAYVRSKFTLTENRGNKYDILFEYKIEIYREWSNPHMRDQGMSPVRFQIIEGGPSCWTLPYTNRPWKSHMGDCNSPLIKIEIINVIFWWSNPHMQDCGMSQILSQRDIHFQTVCYNKLWEEIQNCSKYPIEGGPSCWTLPHTDRPCKSHMRDRGSPWLKIASKSHMRDRSSPWLKIEVINLIFCLKIK